jgi:hypothetical protein
MNEVCEDSYDILNGMNANGLKHILKRVPLWPAAAQQEALQSLRAIEADVFDVDFACPPEETSLPAPEQFD